MFLLHEELDSGLCMCVYLCVCAYRPWDQGWDQNLEEALKDMGNRRWWDSCGKTAEVCVCWGGVTGKKKAPAGGGVPGRAVGEGNNDNKV